MSREDAKIPPELRAKLQATLDQVMPSMVHFFWGREGKRPVSLGSGLFITLSDQRARVMTAGHVFDGDGRGTDGTLLMGGPKSPLIALRGKPSRSYAVDADGKDRIDLASFWLNQKTIETLGHFTPFTVEDIQSPAPYDPRRRYAVVGFPASQNSKPVPAGQPLPGGVMLFVGRERSPEMPLARPWIRPGIHLVVNWDHKIGFHSDGGLQTPPGLAGVSGGVVLDLGTSLDPSVRPKVAGVFTHHLKNENALVATRLHPLSGFHQSDKPE